MVKVIDHGRIFYVDDVGNVYNAKQKLIRVYQLGGYMVCQSYKDKRRKSHLIHRLIALAHLPNPLNLPVVHHINNNKLDNRIANLEWQSQSSNLYLYHSGPGIESRRNRAKLKRLAARALKEAGWNESDIRTVIGAKIST